MGAPRLRHGLLILHLDNDDFVRTNVGDVIGEQVGTLLLEEGGLLALGLGVFVDLLGFLLLLDVANDDSVADHHLQCIDGRAIGQGEHIDAFDPAIRRVFEPLGDPGADDGTGDGHVEVGGDGRSFDELAGLIGFEQQAAGAHVVGRDIMGGLRQRTAEHGNEASGETGEAREDEGLHFWLQCGSGNGIRHAVVAERQLPWQRYLPVSSASRCRVCG